MQFQCITAPVQCPKSQRCGSAILGKACPRGGKPIMGEAYPRGTRTSTGKAYYTGAMQALGQASWTGQQQCTTRHWHCTSENDECRVLCSMWQANTFVGKPCAWKLHICMSEQKS